MRLIDNNKMRVLQIHNFYQQAGGEDAVVNAELAMLTNKGHEVRLFTVSNDTVSGWLGKIKVAWQVPYSEGPRKRMASELEKYKPDVAHVHNFFPLLTPSIYEACKEYSIPVVQTLHNYRTICPGALLMRDGHVCNDCVAKSAYNSVLHGCYRGSRSGTLAVARMVEFHRKRGTWKNMVDRFIALTQFARGKFIEGGFPGNLIRVKPNFYSGELYSGQVSDRKGALYVGRLSKEKGIETLLKAWNELDIDLTIIGDGPMLDYLKSCDLESVTVLGRKTNIEVRDAMRKASYLVMPSEWYEGFPMVIVEAFANSLPVIASNLGGLKEIISDRNTGLLFSPGDAEDLTRKVRWAESHASDISRMGMQAQDTYRKYYTPEENYNTLMEIYGEVLGG